MLLLLFFIINRDLNSLAHSFLYSFDRSFYGLGYFIPREVNEAIGRLLSSTSQHWHQRVYLSVCLLFCYIHKYFIQVNLLLYIYRCILVDVNSHCHVRYLVQLFQRWHSRVQLMYSKVQYIYKYMKRVYKWREY